MRGRSRSWGSMGTLDEEKKFYERFYNLHRNNALVRVFQQFGIDAFRRSSVLDGLEPFIQECNFSGEICLEIGTFRGLTAIVLAHYFDRVITVDIIDQPIKRDIVRHLGITNITFVEVKDNKEKKRYIDLQKFDAAYLDGDHYNDTAFDFGLVQRCGNVLFHEYWDAQKAVCDLVNSLSNVTHKGKFARWLA